MNVLLPLLILLTPPETPVATVAQFKAGKTKTLVTKKDAGVVLEMKYPRVWREDTEAMEPFLRRQPIIPGQWHSQCYTGLYGEVTCSLLVRIGHNVNRKPPPAAQAEIKSFLKGRAAGRRFEGSLDDSAKFINVAGQQALLAEYSGRGDRGDAYLSVVFLSFVRNGKVVDIAMWTEGPGVRWNAAKMVAANIRPLYTLMVNTIRFPKG